MSFKVSGVLLTAGLSSRMGEFKPLLKINNKTFLQIILKKLFLICDEVIVVAGHEYERIHEELSEINFNQKPVLIFNQNHVDGMFSSLKEGINKSSNDLVIYHFVDQPGLPEQFYRDFVMQINTDYNWFQPVNKGRTGHPIIIGKEVIDLIKHSERSTNLRDLSSNKIIKKYLWDCNTDMIFQDIDTIVDYKKTKPDATSNDDIGDELNS